MECLLGLFLVEVIPHVNVCLWIIVFSLAFFIPIFRHSLRFGVSEELKRSCYHQWPYELFDTPPIRFSILRDDVITRDPLAKTLVSPFILPSLSLWGGAAKTLGSPAQRRTLSLCAEVTAWGTPCQPYNHEDSSVMTWSKNALLARPVCLLRPSAKKIMLSSVSGHTNCSCCRL
jgi:hypothetical protein